MEILGPPAFPQALDWPPEPAGMLWNGGGRSLQARSCFEGLHSHPQPFWCRNFHGVHRPGWSGCLFSSSFLVIDVRIVQLWKFHVDPGTLQMIRIFRDFSQNIMSKPQTKVWPPGGRYHGTDDAPPNATTQRGGRFSHPPKHVGRGVEVKIGSLSLPNFQKEVHWLKRDYFPGKYFEHSIFAVETLIPFFWLGGGFKYFFTPTLGKMNPFWLIFFRWVGSTTN